MKYKHSDISIPNDNPFANCKLNRQPNAEVLTQIVQNYADGFVLSINGEWGTGKTTFMKMWAAHLAQRGIKSMYFNAWENDFISDPMIALLGELQQLKTDKTGKIFDTLLNIGSKITTKGIPALVKGIVKRYCGDELAEVAEDTLNEGVEIFKAEVIEYENKKNKLIAFKEELSNFIEESVSNKPLVFIVDELDRCRPDYAVEVLERIKHFFSIQGIVFVLSIDKEQLCNSIRGHYGSDRINAEEYLRRFIDVEYMLPEPDVELYCKHLYEYFDFPAFFEHEDRRQHSELGDDPERFLKCAKEIIKAKQLSLRQIEKLFVHTRLVLCSCQSKHYVFPQVTFLLIYIRSIDSNFYLKIRNKQITIQEVADYIPRILPEIMFIDPSEYIRKSMIWAIAELFYCYGHSFTDSSVKLVTAGESPSDSKLTFTVSYADETKIATAITHYRQIYRGAGWSHIIKSIDLLNPILD